MPQRNENLILANKQDLVRGGLKHFNFDNLYSKEKRLALSARGYCLHCGRPTCDKTRKGNCPVQRSRALCALCGISGHYSRLCLQEKEVKLDYMTKAEQNRLPERILSLLRANETKKVEKKKSEDHRKYILGRDTCESE